MDDLSYLETYIEAFIKAFYYIDKLPFDDAFKDECLCYIEEECLHLSYIENDTRISIRERASDIDVSIYTIDEIKEAKARAATVIFDNVFNYYENTEFHGECFEECDLECVCDIIIQTIEQFELCYKYSVLESFIENLVVYYEDFGTIGSDRQSDFDHILKKFTDHFAIPDGLFEYHIPEDQGPMRSSVNRQIYDNMIIDAQINNIMNVNIR